MGLLDGGDRDVARRTTFRWSNRTWRDRSGRRDRIATSGEGEGGGAEPRGMGGEEEKVVETASAKPNRSTDLLSKISPREQDQTGEEGLN